MNCIIVDDEPVARKGMKSLIEQVPQLELAGSFNNAVAASAFTCNPAAGNVKIIVAASTTVVILLYNVLIILFLSSL